MVTIKVIDIELLQDSLTIKYGKEIQLTENNLSHYIKYLDSAINRLRVLDDELSYILAEIKELKNDIERG